MPGSRPGWGGEQHRTVTQPGQEGLQPGAVFGLHADFHLVPHRLLAAGVFFQIPGAELLGPGTVSLLQFHPDAVVQTGFGRMAAPQHLIGQGGVALHQAAAHIPVEQVRLHDVVKQLLPRGAGIGVPRRFAPAGLGLVQLLLEFAPQLHDGHTGVVGGLAVLVGQRPAQSGQTGQRVRRIQQMHHHPAAVGKVGDQQSFLHGYAVGLGTEVRRLQAAQIVGAKFAAAVKLGIVRRFGAAGAVVAKPQQQRSCPRQSKTQDKTENAFLQAFRPVGRAPGIQQAEEKVQPGGCRNKPGHYTRTSPAKTISRRGSSRARTRSRSMSPTTTLSRSR